MESRPPAHWLAAIGDAPRIGTPGSTPIEYAHPTTDMSKGTPTIAGVPNTAQFPGGPQFPGGARVPGGPRVPGGAQVSDGAPRVPGGARVLGGAQVSDVARVPNGPRVPIGGAQAPAFAGAHNGAQVSGNAEVPGHVRVSGGVQVPGGVRFSDGAQVSDGVRFSGAIRFADGAQVPNGAQSSAGTRAPAGDPALTSSHRRDPRPGETAGRSAAILDTERRIRGSKTALTVQDSRSWTAAAVTVSRPAVPARPTGVSGVAASPRATDPRGGAADARDQRVPGVAVGKPVVGIRVAGAASGSRGPATGAASPVRDEAPVTDGASPVDDATGVSAAASYRRPGAREATEARRPASPGPTGHRPGVTAARIDHPRWTRVTEGTPDARTHVTAVVPVGDGPEDGTPTGWPELLPEERRPAVDGDDPARTARLLAEQEGSSWNG
jgi:hypothetical protein